MGCSQAVAPPAGNVAEQVSRLGAENGRLLKEVEELQQAKTLLEKRVNTLKEKNQQLQNVIDNLQGGKTVQPTHRNIFYKEETKKRLPVFKDPIRGAPEVGSLAFAECFAVRDQKDDGPDVWLQLHGGDCTDGWVLGHDAGTVNCVDMTKYGPEKYRTRIDDCEYSGQEFPKKLCSEGFAGSTTNDICLISASEDSVWRELNIEMLLRGVATATIFEQETSTDWLGHYAVNCVQYGQIRTPSQKNLFVTVKPTSRWRAYRAGCCHGPDLDSVRDDIGDTQFKGCSWLKGMKDQLHVKWDEVAFLTGFAFLRTYCAWTHDDCKKAANERLLWVLEEFFAGGVNAKSDYELERAYWLWDEAFDGCAFEEAGRATAYTQLQQLATLLGAKLEIPVGLGTASATPLSWARLTSPLAAAFTSAMAGRLAAGGAHSSFLDAEGTLHTWGSDSDGQCCAPDLTPGESWTAVSAGMNHTLGLTAGGTLHTWGSDSSGQCSAPVLAEGERWVATSAGDGHSLGLTAAGALFAWGQNSDGQCDVPELPTGERWTAVSAGGAHSLGLTDAGRLHTWGLDLDGQCSNAPELPQGERWIAISAGYQHSLGLTAAGRLRAWGASVYGQCKTPTLPPDRRWVGISAGGYHSMGLTSAGSLHAWGRKAEGRCRVPAGERWIAMCAGWRHGLGLTTTGVVRAWGYDNDGQVSAVG